MCALKICKWEIHASAIVDLVTFMIKSIKGEPHNCFPVTKNPEVTSTWVAEKLFNSIKNNPGISCSSMAHELNTRFSTQTTKRRLYKAKKNVLKRCESDYAKSYNLIPDYANILLMTNNGAMVKLSQDLVGQESMFKRLFISFRAQQQGFMKGCRKLIGLDGCHLKTAYGGILISAVTLDANNGIFPLAVCICEGECKESWELFLELFKEHMQIHNNKSITFMSDRQKDLIYALEKVFPGADSRYCYRHVYTNFRSKYSTDILREYFWKAARATNSLDFKTAMDAINAIDDKAYKWLIDSDPSTWACHYFDPFYKIDHITNTCQSLEMGI